MIKFIQKIQQIEISATGGYAIYVLMCVTLVTIIGIYQIANFVVNWLQ